MKAETFTSLNSLFENHSMEDVVQLLSNFMNSDEFERFHQFVRKEYGIDDLPDNEGPTKESLLTDFEREYSEALQKDFGTDDTVYSDIVIDKYMNMDTELFDSDDLNEIIDKVAS